jgi:hypothetical protein
MKGFVKLEHVLPKLLAVHALVASIHEHPDVLLHFHRFNGEHISVHFFCLVIHVHPDVFLHFHCFNEEHMSVVTGLLVGDIVGVFVGDDC